jgi:TolB-like protein/DNA-binding winged helix-turn-helix (wHTH) protein
VIYAFGDFELDTTRRVLATRADAKPVDITGRVLDALIYLVERPGQLVDKKTLIEALWPNVVVEEGNLSQTIHTLRRVLGERAGEHRYVVTVPGRGYQFVAEVKERTSQALADATPVPTAEIAPEAASGRRMWIPAAVVFALFALIVIGLLAWRVRVQPVEKMAVTQHPSIAVLPFVDMSEEQDQVHFAEGLSEEILNLLAHADNLRVIARTSSFSFKDQNADIKTIAQRLTVSHVLEGSVRKSGDRVRITAQLIDGSTSAHVWSETYDRDIHDIFGVQREIATAVAGALRVTLARTGPRRAETTSAEAYEHYLQGRLLFNRRAGSDLQQARSHFEQATRLDPSYARAWAGLAGVYFVGRYENFEFPNAMEKWGEAAERAVAVDPELAEGHIRLSQYYMHVEKFEAARAQIERALALDPSDPMVLGVALSDAIYEGRIEDAIEVERRLISVNPLSAADRGNMGSLLLVAGHLPEAQAEMEQGLELSPAGAFMLEGVADVLILQKRSDEALQVISRMPEGYRRDERSAMAHYARGDVRAGDAMLARLRSLAARPDADPGVVISIAEIYALRSDPDRAFEWLEKARKNTRLKAELLPSWMLHENLQATPYFKSLHADPRWNALLAATELAP